MSRSPGGRFRLDDNGQLLEVETARNGLANVARLFVDGVQVDERKTWFEPTKLKGGGRDVVVRWNPLGQATRCVVAPAAKGDQSGDEDEILFTPPPGSLAARLDKLARERPHLYASRHVVIAIVQLLIGLLGIGALFAALLPALDLPSIPWPDISISLPGWVRTILGWPDALIAKPVEWVREIFPSIGLPGFVRTILRSAQWWVPILIALFVAIEEVERRQRRKRAETAKDTANDGTVA